MTAHITFNVQDDKLKKMFDAKLEDAGITETKAFTDFMRCVVTGTLSVSDGVSIVHG